MLPPPTRTCAATGARHAGGDPAPRVAGRGSIHPTHGRRTSSAQTSVTISPTSPNLTASMRRFNSACCRRFGSPRAGSSRRWSGPPGGASSASSGRAALGDGGGHLEGASGPPGTRPARRPTRGPPGLSPGRRSRLWRRTPPQPPVLRTFVPPKWCNLGHDNLINFSKKSPFQRRRDRHLTPYCY